MAWAPEAGLAVGADPIDADAYMEESEEPGANRVSDEQGLLSPSAKEYLQGLAARVEGSTRVRLFLLAPPAGLRGSPERSNYLRGLRQGLGVGDESVVIVADPGTAAAAAFEVSAGFKVAERFKGGFGPAFSASVGSAFGGAEYVARAGRGGAAVAAFENVAACLLAGECGVNPLPEERVRAALGEVRR